MSMNEETQTILIDLRNENNELKGKLKNLSKQFENKCEEVIQCDKDYKQFKVRFSNSCISGSSSALW